MRDEPRITLVSIITTTIRGFYALPLFVAIVVAVIVFFIGFSLVIR